MRLAGQGGRAHRGVRAWGRARCGLVTGEFALVLGPHASWSAATRLLWHDAHSRVITAPDCETVRGVTEQRAPMRRGGAAPTSPSRRGGSAQISGSRSIRTPGRTRDRSGRWGGCIPRTPLQSHARPTTGQEPARGASPPGSSLRPGGAKFLGPSALKIQWVASRRIGRLCEPSTGVRQSADGRPGAVPGL
jgi:hypothetical protein